MRAKKHNPKANTNVNMRIRKLRNRNRKTVNECLTNSGCKRSELWQQLASQS